METETLSELEEAKCKGKKLGRPSGSQIDNGKLLQQYPGVVKDLKNGLSMRKTAAFRKVSVNTVDKR